MLVSYANNEFCFMLIFFTLLQVWSTSTWWVWCGPGASGYAFLCSQQHTQSITFPSWSTAAHSVTKVLFFNNSTFIKCPDWLCWVNARSLKLFNISNKWITFCWHLCNLIKSMTFWSFDWSGYLAFISFCAPVEGDFCFVMLRMGFLLQH